MTTKYLVIVFLFVFCFVGYSLKTMLQCVTLFLHMQKEKQQRRNKQGQQVTEAKEIYSVPDPPLILRTDEIPTTSVVLH